MRGACSGFRLAALKAAVSDAMASGGTSKQVAKPMNLADARPHCVVYADLSISCARQRWYFGWHGLHGAAVVSRPC